MHYQAIVVSKSGKKKEITEAENRQEASKKIKNQNPTGIIISIREVSPPLVYSLKKIRSKVFVWGNGGASIQEKISVISQMAVMMDAGISMDKILDNIAKGSQNKRLKVIYESIAKEVDAGKSMSGAMRKHEGEFGGIVIAMTKLGENTGNMPHAYGELVKILEGIRGNISKFKKAIRSPIITLVAMMLAFVVLIMYVVPAFKEIFSKAGADLPFATKMLLFLEDLFSHYGLYIILVLSLFGYAIVYAYRRHHGFRYMIDKMFLSPKSYLINRIIFTSSMHRYMLVMSELVKSGIPIAGALTVASGMVENTYMKKKLLNINPNIAKGMSLSDALEQTELLENMLLQMIRAGESSGHLGEMLDKVAKYYDTKFQDIIDNLTTYIEPILLFFIACLVLLMALGIFMPMWDLGRALNG